MVDKVLYKENTEIKSGKYTFRVSSFEDHWLGGPYGTILEWLGYFLNQTVKLIDCDNPTRLESLAIEVNAELFSEQYEITSKPDVCPKIKHNELVDSIRRSSHNYLKNIRKAVKESL